MKKGLITLTFLSFSIISILAQVSQGFNFQAIARNAAGELITETKIDVTIKIRSGSESGTVVWEEKHAVTTNEFGLFNIVVCGDDVLRTGGTALSILLIDWASALHFLDLQIDAGQGNVELGATQLRSVPYSLVSSSSPLQDFSTLEIQPKQATEPGEALFIVRREDGYPIFAVYEDGVEVYTDDAATGKGIKGGFAVGGYNLGKKGIEQTYMSVTSDSTRIYVNDSDVKGIKGGFAVGGYNNGKGGEQTYMSVSGDSTRIYVNDLPGKGIKGGFAVGGYNLGKKGPSQEFLRVTQDSTRVYVNTDIAKGIKGGFAVGGYSKGKGDEEAFMTLQQDNYFIGHRSGSKITTGLYNSVIGYESGYNITSGESNAFLGYQAGYMNSTGTGNLFLGYQTGYSNELGNYNTFIGYNAGLKNYEGKNNTFMGSFSGQNNVGGSFNAFLGDSTGFSNTIGSSNTFFGTAAGMQNTSGESNVLIGTRAGYTNSWGSKNVFIGHNSGYSNLSGGSNVSIGTDAGYNSISTWNNVLLGTRAGLKNTDGQGNVMIGYESGMNNINGHNNIFLGPSAGLDETGSYKLYIGYGDSTLAMVWGDMHTRQMRFNSNIGINTTPTDHTLSIFEHNKDASISLEGLGTETVFSSVNLNTNQWSADIGYSIQCRRDRSFGIMLRDGEQYLPRFVMDIEGRIGINGGPEMANITVHEDNAPAHMILKGVGNEYDYAMISLFNSLAIDTLGFQLSYMTDDAFVIAYKNVSGSRARMKISNNGNIMLNSWDHATEVLDVQGNARFRGVGAAAGGMDLLITPEGVLTTSTSDARMKEDLQPIINSLEKVLLMDGMTFTWKDSENGSRDAGLIAQDVAEIFPEAVFANPNDGYYGINYSRFPALFVEAFKEQQQIIDEQKSEINDLKVRLEKLESLLLE